MLLKELEKRRGTAAEDLVRYPLGAICFLLDTFRSGAGFEEAVRLLRQQRIRGITVQIVVSNEQLLHILWRQADEIMDVETVVILLFNMVFHCRPNAGNCA